MHVTSLRYPPHTTYHSFLLALESTVIVAEPGSSSVSSRSLNFHSESFFSRGSKVESEELCGIGALVTKSCCGAEVLLPPAETFAVPPDEGTLEVTFRRFFPIRGLPKIEPVLRLLLVTALERFRGRWACCKNISRNASP